MRAYTEDKKHAVEIKLIDHNGSYIATAFMCDGQNYGGDSWWFCIGYFKTLKGAQKSSINQMAQHGYKIEF